MPVRLERRPGRAVPRQRLPRPEGQRLDGDEAQSEIQEARRLLYVGMTRARERLVLTRVERRFGLEAGGSTFLEEMSLDVQGAAAG